MNEDQKHIDKYFNTAKKYKSPVSRDYARSLLGKKDLDLSKYSHFTGKGVKIMTITSSIIATMIIGALSFGVFESDNLVQDNVKNTEYVSKIENDTKISDHGQNNIQEVKQPEIIKEKATNNVAKEIVVAENTPDNNEKPTEFAATATFQAEPAPAVDTKTNNTDKNNSIRAEEKKEKIQPLNSIILSETALNKMGIYYGTEIRDSVEFPGIVIRQKNSRNLVSEDTYCAKFSSHGILKLSSEDETNFLKLSPTLITNFSGGKRLIRSIDKANNSIEEFMPFHVQVEELFKLDFQKDYRPEEIPAEIQKEFDLLKSNIESYYKNTDNKLVNEEIEKKLGVIYQYFKGISEKSITDEQEWVNDELDSNFHSKQIIYSDNPKDTSNQALKKKWAEMGIKVYFAKPITTMKGYLEENVKDLAECLIPLKKQLDNYIMINEMVAIEIPYKNSPDNDGIILWYFPSEELLDMLPESISSNLQKEFELLRDKVTICGAPIEKETAYLDIWRSCSGAIENLRIFPNPVADVLNIKFELNENRDLSFDIYNTNGEMITNLDKVNNVSEGSRTFAFDMSSLQKGIYLLVVGSNSGEQAVQRLVKE